MSIAANRLDEELARIKKAWEAAPAGSQEREVLHQQAETLRSAGASEAVSNFLVYGTSSGAGLQYAQEYMGAGWTPEADLAQRLSTALGGQQATGTTGTTTPPQTVDLSGLTQATQPQPVALPAYQRQAIPQTDLSALGAAGPQTPITMPAYTPTQAQPVDLSALQARAGQVPEMRLPTYEQRVPQRVDLGALKTAGPQTAITAPAYTPPSTEQLRTGISAMPSITAPTATTPQAFMSEDVQKAIAAQGQGQAPAPMAAQFGTPEQFGRYVAQTQQMLQPYTDAQKQAATAAFNEAMQKLGGQWAARGMLASGAAAGAQQQAAQGFGVQMGLLEAQQLEQAINTALQAGQLSTTEAQAIWNQAMTGTQFGQQQATTQAQLLQQALAQQEQQRLAEQNLGLNVQQAQAAQEQARMAALQSALGLETQQTQFGAQLGLETQQTEMQRQQALADNLARTLGMDISQKQWGQEFTRAQLNDIFQQAVTSQQLSEQQRQAAINALTQLAQMDIQQGQFGAELGAQQQQFGANLSLAVQQAEAQRQQQLASNLAQKMGMQIQQAQWGAEFGFAQEKEIFNQAVTSQQLDYQERQAAQDALLKLAQMEIQQQQFGQQFGLEQAGVTGAYQGQPTLQAQQLQAALQAQQWDQAMDTWQAELKLSESQFNEWLKTETLNLDKAKAATDKDYKQYLKDKNLTQQQGDTATNGYLSQILNLPTAEAAFQYIVQNADAIVNDGTDVSKLLQNLRYRWPDFYRNATWNDILLNVMAGGGSE